MRRDVEELGNDLRTARLASGLTLRSVAASVGVSAPTILRIERNRFPPGPSPELIAKHAAAVGMRARIKVYPEGPPIRDAASVALIRAFGGRLGPDSPKMLLEQYAARRTQATSVPSTPRWTYPMAAAWSS